MSNRARLILYSGINGSDVTAIARAAAEAALDEGLRVSIVEDGPARPMPAELAAAVQDAAGRLGAVIGADRLPVDVWSSLPGMTALSTLAEAAARAGDPGIDVVVVDCGDACRAVDIARAPALALRVVDALLTPTLAMWRPPGGGDASTEPPFTALSSLRERIDSMRELVEASSTTMRLVTSSDPVAIDRAGTAAATFALLGVGVDGIVVRRPSRKATGSSKAGLDAQDDRIARFAAALAPVTVWSSGGKPRPVPKGRSVLGPLSGDTARLAAGEITVVAGDEDFVLDLPLLGRARDAARVGVRSGDLVVEFDGVQRWLQLPPLLQRCRPIAAVRTGAGLRVRFVPDPELWPGILAGDAA